jgi:hypothetical protein
MTPHLPWVRVLTVVPLALALVVIALPAGSGLAPPAAAAQSRAAQISERLRMNQSRAVRLRAVYDRLAATVATLPDPGPVSETRGGASIAALTARLEAGERALTGAGPDGQLSAAELERRLTAAERTRSAPPAPVPPAPAGARGLTEDASMRGLEPVSITLVKNRLVPLEAPFYSASRAQVRTARGGQTVAGVVVRRVHDGEPVREAIGTSGLLDERLRKADRSKHYVMLSVCADSIAAFRAVVDELTRRGFAYAWDTGRDEDIVLSESNLRTGRGNAKVPEGILPRNP